MHRTEELLKSVVESAVDAIIVIDAGGLIQSFNPAAEHLFGYSAQEALGRNVSMLMPSPDREQHDGYLHRHLTTGHQKIIGIGRQVTGLRKDGSTFPLHLSVGRMTIDGKPAFTGILHDLSRRVEVETALRKSEERLRSIVESAVDGIIVIDELRQYSGIQPGGGTIVRLQTANDVLGRNVKRADAEPGPRAARRLSSSILDDGIPEDHRHRTRGDRSPQERNDIPAASVGG